MPLPLIDAERLDSYEIRHSPGKGLGVFAKRHIKRGDRIMSEKPIIHEPDSENAVIEAYKKLDPEDKARFHKLHRSPKAAGGKLYAIFCTNRMDGDLKKGVLCDHASRINHSCIPNAHFSYNSNLRRETIHAIMDILPGQEITICYNATETFLPTVERNEGHSMYNFFCTCPACYCNSPVYATSEQRRAKMFEADRIQDELHPDNYFNDKETGCVHIDVAKVEKDLNDRAIRRFEANVTLKNLLLAENLVGQNLCKVYHDTAQCCMSKNDWKGAIKYVQMELELLRIMVGRDSQQYQETKEFLKWLQQP